MLSPAPLCSLTYALGRSLYVPLTCRSNSRTLPDTRGPGFVLPADVVGSLLEVRRLELHVAHASGGGDGNISSGDKMLLPPLDLSYVSHIDDTVTSPIITDDMLCKDIESRFQEAKRSRKQYDSLVIAGEGEPTLRLSTLLSIVRRPIRSACFGFTVPTTVRVVTNGLGDAVPGSNNECAKQMKEAGVSGVSVALMTASSDQYDELMHPYLPEEISTPALDVVCAFIGNCVDIGLNVEVTGVDREEVDKEAAEELARSLGVIEPVRWRPYFP